MQNRLKINCPFSSKCPIQSKKILRCYRKTKWPQNNCLNFLYWKSDLHWKQNWNHSKTILIEVYPFTKENGFQCLSIFLYYPKYCLLLWCQIPYWFGVHSLTTFGLLFLWTWGLPWFDLSNDGPSNRHTNFRLGKNRFDRSEVEIRNWFGLWKDFSCFGKCKEKKDKKGLINF